MPRAQIPATDLARIERYCRTESPPQFRDQLRVEHHIRGKSVILCETRPPWDGHGAWTHFNIAQLRYRPESGDWSLHWSDRNSRWHPYEAGNVQFGSMATLLSEIDKDPTCIFRG